MGRKGSNTLGSPLGAWHVTHNIMPILCTAFGGRGLRPYSADKAAELREAKYFLRGHTAGRDGVGLDPSLSDFGVSLFPISLPGGHRGGQLGN